MNNTNFSFGRIFKVVLPIIVLALVGYFWWSSQVQAKARSDMASNILSKMIGEQGPGAATKKTAYSDSDGDLLADSPPDAECLDPDPLIFTFIAGDQEQAQPEIWQELLDAIAEKTGRKVEIVQFSTTAEQLAALEKGEVHIAGMETGAVEAAVERSGFIPVCTFGHDDGTYGYTMKIIVPAESEIKDTALLNGKKITFTRPTSNSGFKAPFVLLMEKHDMLPERDYVWSFSLDHKKSIELVALNKADAAPVASDLLAKEFADGRVEEDAVRTIYESERFPPAAIGYAHNLTKELRDGIRQVLLDFDWKDTGLEEHFGSTGASRFVAISYKNDWANIRHIDQILDRARTNR